MAFDILRHEESFTAFLDASRTRADPSRSSSSHRSHSDGWAGTRTYAEAQVLAREGWPEGRKPMGAVNLDLPGMRKNVLKPEDGPAGALPNIPAYLAGSPDSMTTYRRTRKRGAAVVSIAVCGGGVCSVGPEEIRTRGAALLALIDAIEAGGKQIELHWVYACVSGAHRWTLTLPLKGPGFEVSPDAIAFAVASPAMLRRLVFGYKEGEPAEIVSAFGFTESGDMGRSVDLRSEEQKTYDLYLRLNQRQKEWRTLAAAQEWVLRKAEELHSKEVNS